MTQKISKRQWTLKKLFSVGLVALALNFSACLDSDDSSESSNPMQPESLNSIADVAISNPQFSTLVQALQAAGLVETLQGEGPFTVFAPTNAAFAAVPNEDMNALFNDPAGALRNVLLYHVVSGKVNSATVVGLSKAASVGGPDIGIMVMDGKVKLNESATVVQTDIEASNGIIHVIDAVILPPAPVKPTIAEIASGNADFSTLLAALKAAELDVALQGAGPFTVFAPTNAAFAALPAGTLDQLLAEPKGALKDILLYHVVSGAVKAGDVVNLTKATSLGGGDIGIMVMDGKVKLNESATVVQTDIEASNGIIHVIDAVILPAAK